jgi:hypothetical protein
MKAFVYVWKTKAILENKFVFTHPQNGNLQGFSNNGTNLVAEHQVQYLSQSEAPNSL